ncbi:MAG: hypothetical protein ACRECQ_16155 [Burkholderiaceae bacterium]
MLMRVRERQNEVQIELTGVAGRQESVLAALDACQQCITKVGSAPASVSVRARADGMQVRLRPTDGQQLDVQEIYRCLRRALIERTRTVLAPRTAAP